MHGPLMECGKVFTQREVFTHIFSSPRLRRKFYVIPDDVNPGIILYTTPKDAQEGVRHYAELGVTIKYIALYQGREPLDGNLPYPIIKEDEIIKYPECEIVLYRIDPKRYVDLPLAYRLARLGIQCFLHTNIEVDPRDFGTFHYPNIIKNHRKAIVQLYNSLLDQDSRDAFAGYIKGRAVGSTGYHRLAGFPEYHHPKCRVENGDVVLEAGLEDGMTTIKLGKLVGEEGKVYGFEADPLNWERIERNFKESGISDRLMLIKAGIWNERCVLPIICQGGSSSITNNKENATLDVQLVTIDDFCTENAIQKVNVIKMDIEKAEMRALKGAVATIQKNHPKLMISVYHTRKHIFEIVDFINSLDCGYRYYIGCHTCNHTETDIYAVPQ